MNLLLKPQGPKKVIFPILFFGFGVSGWTLFYFFNLVMPGTIHDLLASIFVGHLFNGDKKTFWLAINQTFFWTLWCERNERIFNDQPSTFDSFMDLVIFNALCSLLV